MLLVELLPKQQNNSPDGVKGIGSKTSTSSNTPAKEEGCNERAIKSANENDRF
jgi:hypothetical protein